MKISEWIRQQNETFRREFDERYQQQRLLAMRDAFLVMIGAVLVLPLLSYVLRMPSLLAFLPIALIFLGGLGGFVSLIARNTYSPRGAAHHALWKGGGMVVGTFLALSILALLLPALREYLLIQVLTTIGITTLIWLTTVLFARRSS